MKQDKVGIIFDLDGTLWDAIGQIRDSYNLTMNNIGLPYRFNNDQIRSYMGLTPEETVKFAFPDVDSSIGQQYFNLCFKDEIGYLKNHPGRLYPNEINVLTKLKEQFLLFIVSNSDKGYIENYLDNYKLHHLFKDHLCAGDTKKDKSENILLIKEKYNLDKVIYIGDTLKDYLECQKAKVEFIHARYGFGVIKDDVPFINSLDELLTKINQLL